ncbi:hypothetical protein [Nitrososphaera viennensis]|uniref:Uncharacterized protein n=2 Tax=Nitrososphaera viennensis TaxID=1034015 RepID=A0A060HJD2_9ARCH|nr:hypothetical protein [Nitrososphaera viennensis]AIC16674.1 hypothetical protein NVIE_2466 [Nitrososphaera viennensis EN76]UVS68595.1 hypothetical protein NWT39_11885 [Nitrososphaera viennensis]
MLDRNAETLDKLKHLDAEAVVQHVITKSPYFGEDSRGAKITVVIDSDYVPIATYVKCLGPDTEDGDDDDHHGGELPEKLQCV